MNRLLSVVLASLVVLTGCFAPPPPPRRPVVSTPRVPRVREAVLVIGKTTRAEIEDMIGRNYEYMLMSDSGGRLEFLSFSSSRTHKLTLISPKDPPITLYDDEFTIHLTNGVVSGIH